MKETFSYVIKESDKSGTGARTKRCATDNIIRSVEKLKISKPESEENVTRTKSRKFCVVFLQGTNILILLVEQLKVFTTFSNCLYALKCPSPGITRLCRDYVNFVEDIVCYLIFNTKLNNSARAVPQL